MSGHHHAHHSHHTHRTHRTRRSRRSEERSLRRYLPALLALAAGLAALLFLLFGPVGKQEQGPDSSRGESVVINGVKCRPKSNLSTYLVMGIDDTGEVTDEYTYGGQADVLLVLVVDKVHQTWQQLAINRNTMTEVHSYDEDGEDVGTSRVQISYAHMAGDGGTFSCENTVRAVSDLLMGQHIDGYVSMNMDCVSVLNNLAGGVTVTVVDDFSQADPSLERGATLRLTDEQAYTFVRGRMSVGDGTNESRMRRQAAFLNGLRANMMELALEDEGYPLRAYNTMKPYITTDLTDQDFTNLAAALVQSTFAGEVSISGSIGMDDFEQATFEPDQDSLGEAVIELFYNRES